MSSEPRLIAEIPVQHRVQLPDKAAERLRLHEDLVRQAVAVRDAYGSGLRDGLGIEGAITGFDEVTGELIVEEPESD
jgi:hypothetical protein